MLENARCFLNRGWRPIPVPFREKGPVIEGWQHLRLELDELSNYFRGRCNVGVLTGEPSGWLIDIDLDHQLAVQLAPKFFPVTACVFGRPGKPRSHLLYHSPGATTHQRTTGKVAGMIVELRSTGLQTVFPGSVHESGELVEWAENGNPAVIDPNELRVAVDALADEVERRLGIGPRDGLDDDAEHPDVSEWTTQNDQGSKLKPGVDFNARGDIREVLRRHGWTLVREQNDGIERWRRPGKSRGISGSLKDGKAFYCFTSSTAIPDSLESKRGYSPFAVLTYLDHGGDFSAAAKALATQGYGEKPKPKIPGGTAAIAAARIRLPEPFVPFPVQSLPHPVSAYVLEAARAIGCDPTLVGLPMLAALAGCVGATRRIRIKHGWYAPAVLWTASVVDSGQQKSPAQGAVTMPLYQRLGRDLKEHQERVVEYQKQLAVYEQEFAEWKKLKGPSKGDPPEKPQEPTCKRIIISDSTIEAVADRLNDNNRGLLLDRDELSGWLGSYDQYRGGKGSDVSHWLSCYNAKPMLIDRKTSTRKVTYVEKAAVSITGGIQPRILARLLGQQHFENGLAARFGFGMPPKRSKRWSNASVSSGTYGELEQVYDSVLALGFRPDREGNPIPVDLPLTTNGMEAFVEFYNQHGEEQGELTGNLAALWAKLEEAAARIALIVHLVRCAVNDSSLISQDAVDHESVVAGIAMARWLGNEGRRIYDVLAESDIDRDRRQLIELIERKGGALTVRELTRCCRHYEKADLAEDALCELIRAGAGRWEVISPPVSGGHATKRFMLFDRGSADTRGVFPAENPSSASVSSERQSEIEDAEEEVEWTEES